MTLGIIKHLLTVYARLVCHCKMVTRRDGCCLSSQLHVPQRTHLVLLTYRCHATFTDTNIFTDTHTLTYIYRLDQTCSYKLSLFVFRSIHDDWLDFSRPNPEPHLPNQMPQLLHSLWALMRLSILSLLTYTDNPYLIYLAQTTIMIVNRKWSVKYWTALT